MAVHDDSGCLVAIFRLFGGSAAKETTTTLPYRRKDYLLTKAERAFFVVLRQAIGQDYLVFAKVRVADLLWMPKGTDSRRSHFNKIQAKHIDFVLCDTEAVRPILAIELDDSSHGTAARQSRDAFVDDALHAAGLPLVRVACKAAYNVNALRAELQAAISPAPREVR